MNARQRVWAAYLLGSPLAGVAIPGLYVAPIKPGQHQLIEVNNQVYLPDKVESGELFLLVKPDAKLGQSHGWWHALRCARPLMVRIKVNDWSPVEI